MATKKRKASSDVPVFADPEDSDHGDDEMPKKSSSSSSDVPAEKEKLPKKARTGAARSRAKKRREKAEAEAKGYHSATVFVGQLHFLATEEELANFFTLNDRCEILKVRIRKDRRTGKSLGTAFVDLVDKHQIPNALRLHHTMFKGRQINIERTVGGGGNGENRKEKLQMLRDVQQNQSQRDVEELFQTMITEATENDDHEKAEVLRSLDDRVRDALLTFPNTVVRTILEEYTEAMSSGGDVAKSVENANA